MNHRADIYHSVPSPESSERLALVPSWETQDDSSPRTLHSRNAHDRWCLDPHAAKVQSTVAARVANVDRSDAPMRRCADAPMRRCADAPMRRSADAPMRRCADAPMRRCADAPMRRCADAPMRRGAEAPKRRSAEPPNRRTAEPPKAEAPMRLRRAGDRMPARSGRRSHGDVVELVRRPGRGYLASTR
jgi:hypothetical protein